MKPLIHPSARPEARRQAMIKDLAANRLPSAFLYESSAQSQRWLAVHRAFSPFINDSNCWGLYNWIGARAAARIKESNVHVVGLGCGSGAKDSMLLEKLNTSVYWPVDISQGLVLEAVANSSAPRNRPLVLDLARAQDIGRFFDDQIPRDSRRVYTLFGLLPNFDPKTLPEQLRGFLQSGDFLLFSTNLAPGDDLAAAVERIMPQYDNSITRDWLIGALSEIGIPVAEGNLVFEQEEIDSGLRRIVARWHFRKSHQIQFSGVNFTFRSKAKLEVFYSIRYTIPKVNEWLEMVGLSSIEHQSCDSGEEAVFLCQVL